MEEDKIIGKLHFSFTNTCETTTVDRIFNEEPESYETIWWFLEEFKYFLKAEIAASALGKISALSVESPLIFFFLSKSRPFKRS